MTKLNTVKEMEGREGKETTESRQAGRGQNIEAPFPPSRILVERRLNDATTTIAILL